MYERIFQGDFLEIMRQLTNKPVWVKILANCIDIDVFYPNFEFLHFIRTKQYQFGHAEYNEENNYQNILIDTADVALIHKDIISLTQIIIELADKVQLIVECDY